MAEKIINIPGRLKSIAVGGYVTGAEDIYDDSKEKDQATINADVDTAIGDDSTAGSIKGRIKVVEDNVGNTPVSDQIDAKINALDSTKSQAAGDDGLSLSISEVDGKISSISGSIAANTYDSHGAAATAKSELLGDAGTNYNTLGKLEDKIQEEASDRATAITSAINALDATKSQTAGTDGLALSITQTDGKIESISGSIAAQTYDAYGAASTAKSEVIGDAATAYNTLGKIEDKLQEEATTREEADEALDGRVDTLETAIGTGGSVDTRIATAKSEIIGDAATDYNTLGKLEDKIQQEVSDRGTAITNLVGDAATAYNTLGKLEDKIQEEATARSNADTALDGRVDDIEGLIPTQATTSNQLADKEFVNSSISTATATYKGSKNLITDLSLTTSATEAQIATALSTAITTADSNDYCFVQIPTSDSTPTEISSVARYKYNGSTWSYEYTLNSSGFTASQWSAINSGITSALVTAFNAKYDKPSTGIPKTDLASGVQASLDLADSAIQSDDLATVATTGSYNDLSNKPDINDATITIKANSTTVDTFTTNASATKDINIPAASITAYGVTKLSDAVTNTATDVAATSNAVRKAYNLANSKQDPATTLAGYGITDAKIESGVITLGSNTITPLTQHQDISGKADKSEMSVVAGTGDDADKTTITLKTGTSATVLTAHQDISGKADSADLADVATSGDYGDLSNTPTIPTALSDLTDDATHRVVTDTEKNTWSGKQDTLVSGTTIKTINGASILGSGNITVAVEDQIQADWAQTDTTAVDYIKNKPAVAAIATCQAIVDELV